MHNCNCYTIQRDNQLFCKTNNDTSKILLEKQYYNIQSLICWDKLKKPIVYWKTNFGESIFHAHNERIKKPFHWHFWKGYNITEEKSKQRGSLTQKVSPQKHRQHQFSWQVSIALIWLIGKCNQSLKFHPPPTASLCGMGMFPWLIQYLHIHHKLKRAKSQKCLFAVLPTFANVLGLNNHLKAKEFLHQQCFKLQAPFLFQGYLQVPWSRKFFILVSSRFCLWILDFQKCNENTELYRVSINT